MSHPLPPDWGFHHVGVACADIAAEEARFALLGYRHEIGPFTDARQGVRGKFIVGHGPRLELLEPLSPDSSTLAPWLDRDHKLYHLAYETGDLVAAIAYLRKESAKLMMDPTPAVAFDGREIAFVMLPNRMLVELIARNAP
jgi:methylmalonyl-CoA/ethylmalonyl-CoA epimerase